MATETFTGDKILFNESWFDNNTGEEINECRPITLTIKPKNANIPTKSINLYVHKCSAESDHEVVTKSDYTTNATEYEKTDKIYFITND